MARTFVCKESEIPVGEAKAFKIGGTGIAVYHLIEGYFATQASCSHTFAPLARGKIVEGGQIQCPLHRARFDIRTGEVIRWANFPPGVQVLNLVRREKALKTYAVAVEAGQVFVEI